MNNDELIGCARSVHFSIYPKQYIDNEDINPDPAVQVGSPFRNQAVTKQIVAAFSLFARHGHNLTGASPERAPIAGSAQSKAPVSTARRIGRKLRTKVRLQTISHDIANNEAAIVRMKEDYAKFNAVVQRDKDGNPVNNLMLDNCKNKDEQNMGVYLQELAQRTDTHGQYRRVGEVYGFPVSIISERVLNDGKESVQNRFVVEGNYKYKFNNGFIAMSDTHASCMNFVNALEKIPGIIARYEERTAKLKADVPQLEAIVAKSWGKEDELKQLKSDLAALERKITAELAPKREEEEGAANKRQQETEKSEINENRSQSTISKESLVEDPSVKYFQQNKIRYH